MSKAEALGQLRGILGRIKAGEDEELSPMVGAKEEVLRKYQRVFSDENLPNLTKEDFLGFLRIKNNRHWDGIHRYGRTITKDMHALREALRTLLDESRPLRKRLDELRPPSGGGRIRGLGPATFTPILFVRYPEKYGVFNETSKTALKRVGLWPDVAPSAPFSEQYSKVNELLLDLAKELGIDLWTLDALWWRARDLAVPKTPSRDELRERIEATWAFGEEFTLEEVYGFEEDFQRLYPNNRHIQARLRQILQELRDDETLRFLNQRGTYQRVRRGGQRCWWVNQGQMYVQERKGGYMWAPQQSRSGARLGHHRNVERVSQGDVFLHYAKSAIVALGQARENGHEGARPDSLREEAGDTEGYVARSQYWELEDPILLNDLDLEWRTSQGEGPFNHSGGVKQGYLYPLEDELAERIRERFSHRWPKDSPWGGPVEGPYTIDDAHQDLFIPRSDFDGLLISIKSRKNLILQGPPGTGKTFIARRIAWCIIGRKDNVPIEMVQFHQSYAYEDFVQGYRPTDAGGFELKDGIFHRFCERARANSDMPHVFIIDEINRGNLSRIFGELLMLIEADKRSEEYAVALIYSDEQFHVPENVFILGMMNTADRSLALVDYALRRRFAFETLEPAYGTNYGRAEFEKYLMDKGTDQDLARRISHRMDKLNETIRNDKELGRGFQIGHSYFVPGDGDTPSEDWYKHIVDTQIAPLLREYWFDSPEDAQKEVARLTAAA